MKRIILLVALFVFATISFAQDFTQMPIKRGKQLPFINPLDSVEVIYIDTTDANAPSDAKWEGLYYLNNERGLWQKVLTAFVNDEATTSSFFFTMPIGIGANKYYEPEVLLPTSDNKVIVMAWRPELPATNAGGLVYYQTAYEHKLGQLDVQLNGQIPIGDGNGPPTLTTITGSHAISVTNGAGSITLSFKPPVILIDEAVISTNVSESDHFRVTLGGNRTLDNPTDPTDGQTVTWEFIQDGTGTRTITLGSKFSFGTDITAVVLSVTADSRDFMKATYNSTTDKWYVIDFKKGY